MLSTNAIISHPFYRRQSCHVNDHALLKQGRLALASEEMTPNSRRLESFALSRQMQIGRTAPLLRALNGLCSRSFHSYPRPVAQSSLVCARDLVTPQARLQLPTAWLFATISGRSRPSVVLPAQQIRHCSHRRAMCRRDDQMATNIVNAREVLPTNVRPTHYDLVVEPDLDKFTFHGTVSIDLDVLEDSTSISLNTVDIEIEKATIHTSSDAIFSVPDLSYDKSLQATTLSFNDTLAAKSKAKLQIKFTGIINDEMAGFYRSSYKNKDGKTTHMASTQFEATDARRAFPCWDEPALKATFNVTILADKGLTCLSNMDVKSEKEVESHFTGKSKTQYTFNTSPIMSTYLLAYVVGELNYVETKAFRVPIRVYAPVDQEIENGKFSMDLAAKTLDFYEKQFASPFPLPKMDFVAIPDFAVGAMENWGLVTFRVVDLLLNEKTSGAAVKERVAEVVQHELAHQW
ncbi:hypothetical protein MRB53_042113 [Persea americana]|nr:hypothetical protein MRB53_042113 [Persea americana]